jgi:glycosyltransferase involved in cell wall biosynthesis
VSAYNAVTDRVIISPEGKSLTISEMEGIFDRAGAVNETIFRRLEFNQVINLLKALGLISAAASIRFIPQPLALISSWETKILVIHSALTLRCPRIKILTAWAAGIPVVATSIAAEGLHYTNHHDILIADDPQSFAEAIDSLFDSPELAAKLIENGRILIKNTIPQSALPSSMSKRVIR